MASNETPIGVRPFARADGVRLGIVWIVSFALFVGNLHYPICGTLWLATMIFTPFYVAILTQRYAVNSGENPGYWKCYAHSMLTVCYASLILAVAQWAYFQYLDHGLLVESYASALSDKEFVGRLESMGYPKNMAAEFAETLRKMRPIDMALQFLWSNILAGIIMAFTTALYASAKKRWK